MTNGSLEQAVEAHRRGDLKAAETGYRAVLNGNAEEPTALHMLGVVMLNTGRPEGAIQPLQAAIETNSNNAEAWFDLGMAHKTLGAAELAKTAFERALSIDKNLSAALFQTGLLLKDAKQWDGATETFRKFIDQVPDQPHGYIELGKLAHRVGSLEDARHYFVKATQVGPEAAQAWHSLGNVLVDLGETDDAITALYKAPEIDPDYKQTSLILSPALMERDGPEPALVEIDRAIARHPDYEWAHITRADILFSIGRLEEAWQEYAWRERFFTEQTKKDLLRNIADWDGTSLSGRHVLLTAEQGLGEQILFSSMIPDVAAQANTVTVECDARLNSLFARSFPECSFVHRPFNPSTLPERHSIDTKVRLGSVGGKLRSHFDQFPTHHGYLQPDKALQSQLRNQYETKANGRPIVGVSWRSFSPRMGWHKSAPLNLWSSLLCREDCLFIDLQYGDADQERRDGATAGINLYQDPAVDHSKDLDAAAAQIAAMDVVVSTSNTTAHLAGALNRPTILVLPSNIRQHWYWFPERPVNPWYPSTKIVQQKTPSDWPSPIEDATKVLDKILGEKN